jgi:carbonic anhydrase
MKIKGEISASDALLRLHAGNARFVAGNTILKRESQAALRESLVAAQTPFAVVLSCSDSRVPLELVFDEGLGSIFVVRVAGNIVAPSIVGSIEFAVHSFGVNLVVVMGHSNCGAIAAAIDHVVHAQEHESENLLDIVGRIAPAVETLAPHISDHAALMAAVTRANVRTSANHLRHGCVLLEEQIREGALAVVGAEYSLATGVVDFFDMPGVDPKARISIAPPRV